MKKNILAVLSILFIVFEAVGAEYEKVVEKKLFNGDTLQEFRLPNQLRVILVPRHQAKVLTYQTWFDVGSLNEKTDKKLNKTGLAHLFEHMMFRGTEKYPDGKFDEITSRIGSDKQNATTYYYRTNYFQSVPTHQLEKILELEADRMANLKLISEILDKEKGAVVGELRRALDNPARLAWDELMRQMFSVSEFRYTVLGTEGEIKGFTLEEAQYYYKTFYAPNNCTLIVVGDTSEQVLMPLVVKHYGKMKPQEIPKLEITPEPAQKKEIRWEGTHPQATSELLVIGYRGPSINSDEIVPLSLLDAHLSQGKEARLHKLLVDKGIAVSAGTDAGLMPDIFEFSVALAEKKKAEEALTVIDKEIARLQSEPISKPAFERALNQELLSLYSGINDNSSLANILGEYLMISGNYLRGLEIVEAYKKLAPADIQKAAKKYLKKDNRAVIIVRPATKASKEKS